jgi:predicted nuclease with RNAse H fold
MITVGVDLAAEAKKTAVAVIEWRPGRVLVRSLAVNCRDADVLAAADGATKVGIDAPFGWPELFIDFVTAHRDRRPLAATDLAGRRQLVYRLTDQLVIDAGLGRPLSVSADLIGHAAMRAAGLLAAFEAAGYDADRSGAGLVVETYPAAALRRWGMTSTQYKGPAGTTRPNEIVDRMKQAVSGLELGEHEALCRRTDDALDAVVCALIARAAHRDAVTWPTTEQRFRARTEGWIVVPNGDLADLVD